MIDAVALGLVLGGVVLLFSGAALSVYGVVLLGLLLGGGGGYLVGPSVGGALGLEGAAAAGAPVVLGALAGGLLGYVLLSAAVALTSFVVGALFAMAAVAPVVADQWYLEWGVAIGVGLVAAALGTLLTKWTMVVVTAVVGAAFTSRSLTLEQFAAARQSLSLDPLLFDVASPLFLALVALGLLSQFGLFTFGYVTRIAGMLPGATVLPGRRRDEPEPEPEPTG